MAGEQFPVTRWSVIDAVKSQDPEEHARALDTLFAAYWKPVYKYVRLRWNRPAEDAQDLTQGFFAEVLERELLAKYDPAKSKLRTHSFSKNSSSDSGDGMDAASMVAPANSPSAARKSSATCVALPPRFWRRAAFS